MFITFEAGEGAGKSTQARLLAQKLQDLGHDVLLTREPGGSPLAETLRSVVITGDTEKMDALTELLIFTAARRDHVRNVITPALQEGKIVICDRYLGSTHALQGAAGVSADLIDQLHESFCQLLPDMTVFLKVDGEMALNRGLARNGATASDEGRFEAKGVGFHRRVVEIFEAQSQRNEEWVTIDGDGSIEDVAARVLSQVSQHPAFPQTSAASAA